MGEEAAETPKPHQRVQGESGLRRAGFVSCFLGLGIPVARTSGGPWVPLWHSLPLLGSPFTGSEARGWVSVAMTPVFSWCLFQTTLCW